MPNLTSRGSRLLVLSCLLAAASLSACKEPHPANVESPDASNTPDASVTPDAGEPEPDAGVEPGITLLDGLEPKDLSPDGRLALLEELGVGNVYLYDSIAGTRQTVAPLPTPERNQTLGVSSSGQIVADYDYPVQAGLWSADTGWVTLGSPFSEGCKDDTGTLTDIAGAWDVSADGQVVVGLAWNAECSVQAFRWTRESGQGAFTSLERLGKVTEGLGRLEPNNRATVVSDDGQVAAGWAENEGADRSPAIWRADGTGFMLNPADNETPGEVLSISADGQVVAGIWGNRGFRWTNATGTTFFDGFPEALPYEGVFPNAMTADGRILLGSNTSRAFVWSEASGLRALKDVAGAAGISLSDDLMLTNVQGVSADGTVVLGNAVDYTQNLPNGKWMTFVLRLPAGALGE